MNNKLQNLFDKIEDQKQDVFEMIAELSNEQINVNPSPGKWSISQIISHLIVAERLSVNYIQKKIRGVDTVKNSGPVEELKMLVLKISQRIDGLKFKAPKYVLDNTVVYSDVEELKSEWSKAREDFRQLLERVEDNHLNKKIYKHAIAGYLNIQHALMFFQEHVTHHHPQIRKLIKTLKK
ncbi:MAG TPA: DinB family protein [Cyclobacteriaceae bacterium]